jgi:hypothetical protein
MEELIHCTCLHAQRTPCAVACNQDGSRLARGRAAVLHDEQAGVAMMVSKESAWHPDALPERSLYICTNVYIDSICVIEFIHARLHRFSCRRRELESGLPGGQPGNTRYRH